MKREIKFRGKRIDNGEWAFGFYVADVEWANYYIYFPEHSGVFIKMKHTLVDPKTVGQFTGLTDKNGKEAFEGDITDEGVIIWHNEYLGFFVKDEQGEHTPLYDIPFFEIIGNIYETKL